MPPNGIVSSTNHRPETKNHLKLFTSPQRLPQYVEVPPNIEARGIISYLFDVLSFWSNPLLFKG